MNGSNISFSLIGTDYINNDNYNLMSYEDASKPKANGLFNQNSHTNAIDIVDIITEVKLPQNNAR